MQTHCYPESQGSFQNNTQNVLNALQQFHNLVGEYPFIKEKYGHVQFSWGGGMEHQTATFLVNTGESLMAHELAHQWFGDKITCGSWVDIWLNEGFATHLASIYMESKYPASAIPTRKAEIDYISSQTGGSVKVNDTTSVGRIFDGRLSYTKGSHLLYMLRWILGDSIFFKGIRQYVKDPALSYRFALNDDLKRNLEQSSGRDLTEFFNDWYAGQGYPSYKVEWYPMGSQYVRIKMDQTTSHASVNFFELPVPLLFRKGTQEKSVVVDNKFKGEEFIRHIGFEPDTVFVDPEYWLITRNNTTKKITDPAAGSGGLVVFPNPIGDQFFVYMRNLGAGPAQIRIHNSLGQLVYSRSVPLFNGSEFLDIPSQGLAGGIYYLQVRTPDGSMHVKKLLK
jgi:hypothetical protein